MAEADAAAAEATDVIETDATEAVLTEAMLCWDCKAKFDWIEAATTEV